MNFVPLRSTTAGAMAIIGTATDEDRNLFNYWSQEAIKTIGPNQSWVMECRIENEDNSLRKPEAMYKVVSIALYNSAGSEIPYQYHPMANGRIHTDRFATHNVTVQEGYVGRVDLSDDAFYYNIGDPSNQVDYALIRYLAVPTDGTGDLLIPDIYTTPIALYCRWMWSMRKNDNRSEIDQNYSMWLKECDRVRGKMKLPDKITAESIAGAWLTIFGTNQVKSGF
jgi:hypothetical protein